MALTLIVTLSKEVADVPEGEALYAWVKEKLETKPEVDHSARITEKLEP